MPGKLAAGTHVEVDEWFIDKDDIIALKTGMTGEIVAVDFASGDLLLRLDHDEPELPSGCLVTVEAEDAEKLVPFSDAPSIGAWMIGAINRRAVAIGMAACILVAFMAVDIYLDLFQLVSAAAAHHTTEAAFTIPGGCSYQTMNLKPLSSLQ